MTDNYDVSIENAEIYFFRKIFILIPILLHLQMSPAP